MAGKDLNKVMLIGRLGQDPELKYTPSNKAVATFTLATSQNWKDDSGTLQEKTDWHRIVAWEKLAEICSNYLKKGKKVYIEGKIQTRSYDDKDGQKKYITEIIAKDLIMLDSKSDSSPKPEPISIPEEPTSDSSTTESDDLPF